MKIAGTIVGVVLLLLGGMWAMQGSNVIGGSMMSGQSQWLWIGLVVIAVGLGGFYWYNLRKRG